MNICLSRGKLVRGFNLRGRKMSKLITTILGVLLIISVLFTISAVVFRSMTLYIVGLVILACVILGIFVFDNDED
jgi:hypothetical protein